MCPNQARVISYPSSKSHKHDQDRQVQQQDSDFLDDLSRDPAEMEKAKSRVKACLAEMALARDNKDWQRMIDLFYPLEEKEPELAAMGQEVHIRAELAFALSQAGRLEQSAAQYEKCMAAQPDNFLFVSGLAYVLYNLVYSAKNRERILPPAEKSACIERAHESFARAQELRPEAVTNYYRQGMLYKNIQNMDLKAAPLFRKAIQNWEAYDEGTKEKRHQEYKNYVKSLYNLSSCLLKQNRAREALACLKKCLSCDENKNILKSEHKYFALAKIHFELNESEKAIKDLEFAASFIDSKNGDYIYELWARVLLAMNSPLEAIQIIGKIPEKFRRQFVRWTEGDCYAALEDFLKARQAWFRSLENDRRSRHKALIRLARMEFRLGSYDQCLKYAQEANTFHLNTYEKPDPEGLFWSSAVCIRQNNRQKSWEYLSELRSFKPDYPMLDKLVSLYDKTFGL